jgi:TrmH family RNA methyltransferase
VLTLRKLQSLPPRTRRRKIERVLQSMEVAARRGVLPDEGYLAGLLELLANDPGISAHAKERITARFDRRLLHAGDSRLAVRMIQVLRDHLLAEMGAQPSEWDLLEEGSGALDRTARRVFPVKVYLEDLRSPFNVGAIFRTAECFGVSMVYLSQDTPLPTHPRAARTSRGAGTVVDWEVAGLEVLEGGPGVFALELGGLSIREFPFPSAGSVIVGSEELGVSPEGLALAERSLGRVSIPLCGAKRSLNVSVAFGVLMAFWHAQLDQGEAGRGTRGG